MSSQPLHPTTATGHPKKQIRKFGKVLNIAPHEPLINVAQPQPKLKLMPTQKARRQSENDVPTKAMTARQSQLNPHMVNCKSKQDYIENANLTQKTKKSTIIGYKSTFEDKSIYYSANTNFSINSISNEDQINWITDKRAASTDVNYFMVLIQERLTALLETWTQNDRLEHEIDDLTQNNELLIQQIENINQVKQLLIFNDQ